MYCEKILIYILTSTNTLIKTEVRPQESKAGDSVSEGLLSLKLKQQLLPDSFKEQQGYLSMAAIAAYVSLNKLDQRQRYRASVNLLSVNSTEFNFTKGSSSSGLGYALALFESWWSRVLNKQGQFKYPIFATGEILTSGKINSISHLENKINAACSFVEKSHGSISKFYLCYPDKNDSEISQQQRIKISKLGGILLPAINLPDLLGELLREYYDGDPLGRWEPFKGLNSFNYEDSVRFFGRDKDVTRLYDDLKQNNGLLIVAGASGSGKSSLIKAGLIPRVEQDTIQLHWAYTTPSIAANDKGIIGFVFEQLNIAWGLEEHGLVIEDLVVTFNHSFDEGIKKIKPLLNGQSKQCLLYLDQYEEVFSENNQNVDATYKELKLIDKISSEFEQLDIVLALRNEYLGRLLENQALLSPVISNVSSQLPLDDWYAIIHEQAAFSGINFEHDEKDNSLDKIIIAEAVQTQYALPMVEFLLEQLYLKTITKCPGSNTLLFEHHEEMGGLSGVIAYRAQAVLDKHKANIDLIDSFFENFVGLNSESLPYARHVHIEEIKSQDIKLYQLVLGFIDANLVVYTTGSNDAGVLKLSHDSLFSHWQRLKEWIDSFKDYLLWRNSIDGLYQRWHENNCKDKIYLIKDKRLINEGLSFIRKKILKNHVLTDYISSSKLQKNLSTFKIIFIFVIVPSLIASVYFWDKYKVKTYLYSNIGMKWEVPFGVNALNHEDIKHMNIHYSLSYQDNQLLTVKRLNSQGELASGIQQDNKGQWNYSYTENGKVGKVIEKSISGKILNIHKYSFSENSNKALLSFEQYIDKVGFSDGAPTSGFSDGAPTSIILNGKQLIGKSKVSRKVLEFNNRGLLAKVIYQDPYGKQVDDYLGIFGKIYAYNSSDLKIEEYNIDKDGSQISSNGLYVKSYDYDSKEQLRATLKTSKNYYSSEERYRRDLHGNVIERSYHNNYTPVINEYGFHKSKLEYDRSGFNIRRSYYGLTDNLVLNSDGFSIVEMVYDYKGNIVKQSFFDQNNNLKVIRKYGHAIGRFEYDQLNNITSQSSYGIADQPILRTTGVVKNIFKNSVIYDKHGNRLEESYFGLNNELVLSDEGAAKYINKYDTFNNRVEQSYFGVDGKPAMTSQGVAKKLWEYDERGNVIIESSFGVNGEPVISKDGLHQAKLKYDDFGKVIEESTYDISGELMINSIGSAYNRLEYDDYGNKTKISFFGKNNKPVLSKDGGVASIVTNFGEGASIGRVSGFEYYGTKGEPILNSEGVSKSVSRFDHKGRMISWANFGINGELVLKQGSDFAASKGTFYENGIEKSRTQYSIDGSYETGIFDKTGTIIDQSFYDKDDNRIKSSNWGYSRAVTEIDPYGNRLKDSFYDENGNPGVNKHGYSKIVYLKDKNGILTHIRAVYDISGNYLRAFNTKLEQIKHDDEDRIFWSYIKKLDSKKGYEFYINLVEHGLFTEEAKLELSKFTSRLKVKGLIEGSKIFLNDTYLDINEVDHKVKPSEYTISLKKKGYKVFTKKVVLKDKETLDLSLKLEIASSFLDKDALLIKALKGEAEAQKNLGNKYLDEKNYSEAMSWYLKSARQNYSPAINNIGFLYDTGKGVEKDLKEAYQWYEKAADNGVVNSQLVMADSYWLGEVLEKNIDKSIFWYQQAAEQGDAYAQFRIATIYLLSEKAKPQVLKVIKYLESFKYLKLASTQNYKPAYRFLAYMYESFLVVDLDLKRAIHWYEKSFNEGNDINAAYFLGLIFYEGKGGLIDFDKAVYWFEKAASNGHVLSASELAKFYLESTTFTKDRKKGLKWLQVAAKLNDSYAINKLQEMQKFGE